MIFRAIAAFLSILPLSGCTRWAGDDTFILDGRTGERLTWEAVLDRAADADVIVLGELHDDNAGHALQQRFYRDALTRWPGAALSMEMLDRADQAATDDYLAGYIDRDQFIEATTNTRWRKIAQDYLAGTIDRTQFEQRILRIGWPEWDTNYQPMIDAAKEAGAPVIAANAPWARYTRLINATDEYAELAALSPAQAALIAIPTQVHTGAYRARFWQVMANRAEGEAPPPPPPPPPAPTPATGDAAAPPANPHAAPRGMTDPQVLDGYLKQLLYDATMADSIARALASGRITKVVHLVGQFHSDFEGGTILELRARRPGVRVLNISLVRDDFNSLREDDRGRADIIIRTSAAAADAN
ncbi:MAG: ChaN family lipoprotein [Phycisphaeraceae bacterium]|nr:MAG: ChaN family lipoprotein [Phycisphaeraceae bacterium]